MEFYFCIEWLTHCLVYQIIFNSDSFTLGFRLGLAILSFCSMCVLLFLYYLMCGCFCNVRVFFVLCLDAFVRSGCFCKVWMFL
jgi:hypothetical protein